ncbi:helix-turn-helix domain-containing protein [Kitasatospora purpeofusca]|uniref:helix-turn-helix domain-containing protein n=1 Tax=Kitasatospora purpeofusca TaxID=67352 RepID=UPI00224ECD0D|nr:helix-turn-helix domain-containing protein [Kitasatospora purpeofusca]MCX4686792.1 helix-turn-helix domain-containing protein [Kitasatospora purpeofusca]
MSSPSPVVPFPGPYLTYGGLAELLGVTESWLRRHIKELPHEKYGREIRFFPEHVAAIRARFFVTPVADLPRNARDDRGALVPLGARGRAVA